MSILTIVWEEIQVGVVIAHNINCPLVATYFDAVFFSDKRAGARDVD